MSKGGPVTLEIRPERPADAPAIRAITAAAFEGVPFSDQSEPDIVDGLRAAAALSVSLVAVEHGEVIGHVAFSPVTIPVAEGRWHGLGPVSVRPDQQGRGVGQALIRQGLDQLRATGAAGCVVLGAPAYYGRFGFESDPAVSYGGASSPYLQRLIFQGPPPEGDVLYHPAFGGK